MLVGNALEHLDGIGLEVDPDGFPEDEAEPLHGFWSDQGMKLLCGVDRDARSSTLFRDHDHPFLEGIADAGGQRRRGQHNLAGVDGEMRPPGYVFGDPDE